MNPEIERKSYGQFYPGGGTAYLLYDGPEEWGVRVDADGMVSLGNTTTVVGEYPNYTVSLPSGMQALINDTSVVFVGGPGFSALVGSGVRVSLADGVRDALAQRATPDGSAS